MIKIKYFFYILVASIVLYSCGDSGSSVEVFDHAAQEKMDNDTIVKFLKNNYYNVTTDAVEPLKSGETALFDDSKLVTKEIKENDINYKLYYYVITVGDGTPVYNGAGNLLRKKGFPTIMDSVYSRYTGKRILNSKSLGITFESASSWFTLAGVIPAWTHSFIHFKGGENITVTNGPIKYGRGGKGILFIPSGLAYKNVSRSGISANSVLLFYIELWDTVENTDQDNDTVASIFEDPDGDGNPKNDDTDKDGIANYLDVDDDGDGILTKYEDKNKDGDPRNDFSDPNNPTIPDYLNRSIRYSKE
ncbi:FKBP-type peptidyl-prolyl cis-trans isomerase [Tenacibaculum halocynthiae]|uniref:FKBP-type peptidyl-prolyl cis-trans isomerase n=1 Tax=Tenacibaculum halocynthiae TaxID=1254437 RepID=UPI0038965BFE